MSKPAVTPRMERVELAPGLEISRLVTGLWQIADMERDGRELDLDATAGAMDAYVDAGYTTFDMADHYGSAEEIVGRYRANGGGGVQALTKWVPEPGALTAEDVRRAVERALDRLRVSSLDLLQLHAWRYCDPAWLDGLFHLRDLREAGLVRHLGVTNLDAAHLGMAVASGVELVSNQVCFSLLDRRAAGEMTRVCHEHGVKLLAYGTLAGGLLSERYLGAPDTAASRLDTWSRMKYRRFVEAAGGWEAFQGLLRTLDRVARRLEVSIPQLACRWVLDQPAVGAVVIGARLGESEHIADNLRILEIEIDPESRAEIDAALQGLEPLPGDCGDEYRKPPFLTASGDLSHHVDSFPPPYETRPAASGAKGRRLALSGTVWEDLAGFSRAVRQGDRISVSGTTATHGDRVIGGGDPAAQAHFVIDKLEGAIESLGGRLEDVVRTRVYVRDLADWEPVARVHGERFGRIQPANTLIRAEPVGDEYLVEMEAEAVVPAEV